jgi:hypothetical protein
MSSNEPRPTRSFHFVWKPVSRTIRITLDHGLRRNVTWAGLEVGAGLKEQQDLNTDGPQKSLVGQARSDGPGRVFCQPR